MGFIAIIGVIVLMTLNLSLTNLLLQYRTMYRDAMAELIKYKLPESKAALLRHSDRFGE